MIPSYILTVALLSFSFHIAWENDGSSRHKTLRPMAIIDARGGRIEGTKGMPISWPLPNPGYDLPLKVRATAGNEDGSSVSHPTLSFTITNVGKKPLSIPLSVGEQQSGGAQIALPRTCTVLQLFIVKLNNVYTPPSNPPVGHLESCGNLPKASLLLPANRSIVVLTDTDGLIKTGKSTMIIGIRMLQRKQTSKLVDNKHVIEENVDLLGSLVSQSLTVTLENPHIKKTK
jgi:hypothetical protein